MGAGVGGGCIYTHIYTEREREPALSLFSSLVAIPQPLRFPPPAHRLPQLHPASLCTCGVATLHMGSQRRRKHTVGPHAPLAPTISPGLPSLLPMPCRLTPACLACPLCVQGQGYVHWSPEVGRGRARIHCSNCRLLGQPAWLFAWVPEMDGTGQCSLQLGATYIYLYPMGPCCGNSPCAEHWQSLLCCGSAVLPSLDYPQDRHT